ncbi:MULTISPECIES: SDR family oxidoreductase [unclassified Nocardioides]|uniref:SDR family oxidoreductase n=1 Tax=unclassified Nocardioides TaxID=2615069 RepID=UPI003609FB43
MTVLVIGATGPTGEEVMTALLARAVEVRAMVRGSDCASRLPGGVVPRIGDLADPATVTEAAAGVRAVVYVGADGSPEGRAALGVVAAVCAAARTMLVVVENDDHEQWIAAVIAREEQARATTGASSIRLGADSRR